MDNKNQSTNVEYKKISELCDLRKGKKVNSTKIKTRDSVPYLLIDTLRGEEPEFFTEDKNYTEAIPEDILIVADGANSGLVGTGVKGAVGSTILRIRINVKDLDKDYLSYFLKSKFTEFNKDIKGTGIPHLKPQKMLELEIRKPSLSEQTLIVQEIEKQFTRLDEAVKSLKSVKQKLEIYRKAVLKKAFEKKDGWEEKKIKEVSEKIQYGLTSKSSMDYSGPRYLRITDIQNRRVNWDEVPFAKETGDIENYILDEDDLVFARTGATVGKSFLIKSCPKNSVFASYLIRIVPNKNKISPDLLYYYFQSPMYWEMISQKKLGIGQPNVNGQILSKLPITLPTSMKEQTAIVQEIESKFSVIDKIEQVINESLEKSEKLRKSILKSAFEGKLVKMEEVGE